LGQGLAHLEPLVNLPLEDQRGKISFTTTTPIIPEAEGQKNLYNPFQGRVQNISLQGGWG